MNLAQRLRDEAARIEHTIGEEDADATYSACEPNVLKALLLEAAVAVDATAGSAAPVAQGEDDPAEVAYWNFDARRHGTLPMSERDAFKAEYRALLAKLERCETERDDAAEAFARKLYKYAQPEQRDSFQSRVRPWMLECFGAKISADVIERCDRFIEESLELVQAVGYDLSRVDALVRYTNGRPAGEPSQEVGGVMVTLAALCLARELDMHDAGETELARILRPEVIEKIRAKQAAKARDIPFSPLPTSAHREESKAQDTRPASVVSLLQRAVPFLREAADAYEDDGNNEPLELARDIEELLDTNAATKPASGTEPG